MRGGITFSRFLTGLFLLVLLSSFLSALLGNGTDLDVFGKLDTGATSGFNYSASANFNQRFISGFLPIGQYSSDNVGCGRLGVLGCTLFYCGDGIVSGTETCDSGALNGIACTSACDSTCNYCSSFCTTATVIGATCSTGGGGGGGDTPDPDPDPDPQDPINDTIVINDTVIINITIINGTIINYTDINETLINDTVELCLNRCVLGTVENVCSGASIESRTCGNFDEDKCSEWGLTTIIPCAYGNSCESGSCFTYGCEADFSCGDWSECSESVGAESVIFGDSILGGNRQERECVDSTNCKRKKIESRVCEGEKGEEIIEKKPIETKVISWCEQNYVQITDKNSGEVVGFVRQEEISGFASLGKLDIRFSTEEFSGYCDYCYDGVKNYGEEQVDCGGSSCPRCFERFSFFDWMFLISVLLWADFVLLFTLFYLVNRMFFVDLWKMSLAGLVYVRNVFRGPKKSRYEFLD